MDLHHGRSAVLALPPRPPAAADERGRVAVGGSSLGAVREDLGAVFRRDYGLVVGVAARVLGSRDQAEDVAQEVFLAFGRSTVPADEARGWLSVAAAPPARTSWRCPPTGSPLTSPMSW